MDGGRESVKICRDKCIRNGGREREGDKQKRNGGRKVQDIQGEEGVREIKGQGGMEGK